MAKHSTVDPKGKKITAALTISGLIFAGVGTQVAPVLAVPPLCDLDFTTEDDAAKTTAIQDAITNCDVVTIDGTGAGNSVSLVSQLHVNAVSTQRQPLSISSQSGFQLNAPAGSNILEVDLVSSASDTQIASLTVEGLTFVNGTNIGPSSGGGSFSQSYGGAISLNNYGMYGNVTKLFVINSSFENNYAGGLGGAIFSYGDVMIDRSTFVDNQALDLGSGSLGGAIYSAGDVYSVNSTYVSNETDGDGGAIWSSGTYLAHNTFYDNDAGVSGVGDVASAYNLYHFGNLFAQTGSESEQLHVFGLGEFNVNVNAGTEFITGTASELGLETTLGLNGASSGSTRTLALTSGSRAVDAVTVNNDLDYDNLVEAIDNAFGGPIIPFPAPGNRNGATTDQRGITRSGNSDAGAFEFGTVSAPVASFSPVVIEVNPRKVTLSDEIITIFGAGLEAFDEILVDGKLVKILSVSNNRITFIAPSGLTGTYDITLSGPGGSLIVDDGLTYKNILKAGARTTVPGFAANSTALTKPMKKEIRSFLKANPNLSSVVCKGYTSAPSTTQDKKLARKRGKVTCKYILSLRPEMTVKVSTGSHTNKPGVEIRRVQITLR